MTVYKVNNKYYIKGTLFKDDGSLYSYTKLAKNCFGIKEAREYERLFRMQWQDIKVSINKITFKELGEQYLLNLPNVKKITIMTYENIIGIINSYIGNKKINLVKKENIQLLRCLKN